LKIERAIDFQKKIMQCARDKMRVETKTNQNIFRTRIGGFVLLLLLSFFHSPVQAASPWKWLFSLSGAPAGSAMRMPSALLADASVDRYYVVDSQNNRLLSYDMDGVFLNSFNAGGQLEIPFDMVRSQDGSLWVVEKGKTSLTRINLEAREVVPSQVSDQGRIIVPDRLQQAENRLFLLDKTSGAVFVLDEQLQVVSRYLCPDDGGGFVDFKYLTGNLWALSSRAKSLYHFDESAKLVKTVPLQDVSFPVSLALDSSGLVYVLDRHQGEVVVVDDQGGIKYRFLKPGHEAGDLYFPVELQFDQQGRLCVVDQGNGLVHVYGR
jgi:streptogramin lyase